MNFSCNITQCMAKAMEHLSYFAFFSIAMITLVRRVAYLAHINSRIKQDTLATLLDLPTLLQDNIPRKAEEELPISLH